MNIITLAEAKKAGKTRYFTGKPCPRNHIAERLVSARTCVECNAERKHQWIINNPDKSNAQKRLWRNNNLEKVRALNLANQKLHRDSANARNHKYLSANRKKANAATANWAKNNPYKVAARAAKYRANKLRATPAWADLQRITGFYETAQGMSMLLGEFYEVDHIVPLQGKNVCGLHVHNNLQIIELRLNRSKANNFI